MIKNTKYTFLLLLLGLVVGMQSCVDTDFDEPENKLTIDESKVVTIQSLLDQLPSRGSKLLTDELLGGEEIYLKATVTADDESGNFYKTLVFQDETNALSIIADQNELNAQFPQGNIVYVKLNGLHLAKDNGLPRLGYGYSDSRLQRIPDALVKEYMLGGGASTQNILPDNITLEQFLNNAGAYYNKVLEIENVEFSNDFLGGTYAIADSPTGPQSINAIIQDCNGREVVLRNSGFSNFASQEIPPLNGTLTAIGSTFGRTLQLFIRDTKDVNFTKDRCDGSMGGGQTSDTELNIGDLQDLFYNQGGDKSPEGFIQGVVISDRKSGMVNNRNVFIQKGDRGILVRFDKEHSYDLGDELKIVTTGRELSEFKGLLQINNVPSLNATELGSTDLPTPQEVTIATILADNNKYESTRVLIKGAMLSGGSTFAGNIKVDDGTGTINIFTFNEVSYANDEVPGGTVEVTAIVSQFNENAQLLLNSSADVKGGTTGGGGSTGDGEVDQDFQGLSADSKINLEGWLNLNVKGNKPWYVNDFQQEKFGECEAYKADDDEIESWLITPTIDTDAKSTLSFKTAIAFWKHQGLSLWISPDFSEIGDASWTEITDVRIAKESDGNYTWVPTGDIDLKSYMTGKVRFAWKYEGTSAAQTTKVRIDDIVLK